MKKQSPPLWARKKAQTPYGPEKQKINLFLLHKLSFFGGIQELPCLSVHVSLKHNFFLTDKLILIKLYTLLVYSLRMCMIEYNSGPKNIKEDNTVKLCY